MTHKEILEQTKSELDRLVSEAKRKLDDLVKPELEVGKWYKDTEEGSRLLVHITDIKDNEIVGYGFGYSGNWLPPKSYFYSVNMQNAYTFLMEATRQEVEDALVKEAERRYKVGVNTQDLFEDSFTWKITSTPKFYLDSGRFVMKSDLVDEKGKLWRQGWIEILNEGKWAQVIEEPIDKFAELKEAHRNGAIIECLQSDGKWFEIEGPQWQAECEYRIKPKAKTTLDQDIQELKDKHPNLRFTITVEDNL